MDESGTLAVGVDVFEVDHELGGVVLRVCKDLRSVERNDVVGDDLDGLGCKVCVVDAEMRVEPGYFIRGQLAGDETLYTRVSTRFYA